MTKLRVLYHAMATVSGVTLCAAALAPDAPSWAIPMSATCAALTYFLGKIQHD